MNKKIIFLVMLSSSLNAMEPTKEKDREKKDLPFVPRSQTVPLRLPSDDQEKEILDFLEIKSDMIKIKAMISQRNVARTLTPNTQMLINLDPKLARNSSTDLHQINCQSTLLQGISTFDTAQKELEDFMGQTSNPQMGSLANDTSNHDRYLKIEDQQLEALCIFMSAYEKDCPDTFPYIISALNSIIRLEKKRKELKGNTYIMSPRLLDFKSRLQIIANSEGLRKSQRKSISIPSKVVEHDIAVANEEHDRARKLLQAAKTYHLKIINNSAVEVSSSEYDQVEILYCDVIGKFMSAFHRQPNKHERENLFAEIQQNLNLVHQLKAQRQEKGFGITNSEEFGTICNFVEFHKKEYEIPQGPKAAISLRRALSETKEQPIPDAATLSRELPQLNAPLEKSRLQKFLDCLH